MSEFTGSCGCELLPSSGICPIHGKARIVATDGKTSRELDWEDEKDYTPLFDEED